MNHEPAQLLADKAAAALLGLSRATLWKRAKTGDFPQPIRLGGRTFWRRDELMALIEQASAERDAAPAERRPRRAVPRRAAA
jgi:predicted DNA-binding transcriptional regulator AlpA